MKNDVLYEKLNGVDGNAIILKILRSLEQKLEDERTSKQGVIDWQLGEIKKLQSEVTGKDQVIAELHMRLNDCRSQSEGNRQLINKLITDISTLQQNVDWYKRTYESRSLLGVIKDKLKHFFK